MHAYIHTYIHTHIHTHTYIHTYIHKYVHIYIYIHLYTYMYMHMYASTHTYTYKYRHTHTYIYTCIHMHIQCIEVGWEYEGSPQTRLKLWLWDQSSMRPIWQHAGQISWSGGQKWAENRLDMLLQEGTTWHQDTLFASELGCGWHYFNNALPDTRRIPPLKNTFIPCQAGG